MPLRDKTDQQITLADSAHLKLNAYLGMEPSSNTNLNTLNIAAAGFYRYPINELIIAYKYRGDLRLLSAMTDCFMVLPRPHPRSLLVPMPSSHARLNERGFDHILRLTKQLSKRWQLPVWQGVARTGMTVKQKTLSRTERLKNMQGQFEQTKPLPTGHKLLLIDDVCTTGATLSALANSLIQDNGALDMAAYVLAH